MVSDVVMSGSDPVPGSVPWGIANRVLGNGYYRLVAKEVGNGQWCIHDPEVFWEAVDNLPDSWDTFVACTEEGSGFLSVPGGIGFLVALVDILSRELVVDIESLWDIENPAGNVDPWDTYCQLGIWSREDIVNRLGSEYRVLEGILDL